MGSVYIKSVEIRRLFGIREGKIDNLRQVNVIVGRNGSGKSTVLEAIYLLTGAYLDLQTVPALPARLVLKGSDRAKFIFCKRRNLGVDRYKLLSDFAPEDKRDFDGPPRQAWWAGQEQETLEIKVEAGPDWPGKNSAERGAHVEYKRTRAQNTLFHRSTNPRDPGGEGSPHLPAVLYNTVLADAALLQSPQVEEEAWEFVLEKGLKGKLLDLMSVIYKVKITTADFAPTSKRIIVSLEGCSFGIPIDLLGSGMRMAFRLLLVGLLVNPGILLIEEVDAFQHPEALEKLIEAILTLSQEQKLQVLMTTHRIETVQSIIEVASRLKSDLAVVALALRRDGKLESRTVRLEDARILHQGGYDFRFLEDYI